MFSSVWLLLLPLVLASSREEHKDIVANTRLRPSEIPEKELKFLLMRALQPPIHNQPKMNVGMEPMIQNWIPLKKRWINIGAHDKHRYISKNMVPYTFGVG